MPLVKRSVEPSALCQQPIPDYVDNELQCMTNNALSGAILQLSSLSIHAQDMFGELFNEANSFYSRANNLQGRIDKLTDKVTRLNSSAEEVSLHDINMRKAFRSAVKADQQVVSRDTLLEALKSVYNTAEKPPPLQILNKFRDDGRDALKIYTDPDYFFNLWREAMQKELRDAKEKRRELKRKERKSNPTYRQHKVKAAVPRSRMKAERYQHGVEFVDAPAVSRKKSEENMIRSQRSRSSRSNHTAHAHTPPSYPSSPPPPMPKYNNVPPRDVAYAPRIQTPPTPSYTNPVYDNDPPPHYSDLPEPPPPPPIHHSPVPPSYLPPDIPPPLPPSPHPPQNDVEYIVTPSSPTPTSPSMHSLDSLSSVPAHQMDIPPPPPPPPLQTEPVQEDDEEDSPAHQSEMAKMLASVQLNKVKESDRPAPVLDSRSELLQAIRVGHSLKKVEREEKSSATIFSGNDVAAILARSVVMLLSDSESDSYTSDDDSEWDV